MPAFGGSEVPVDLLCTSAQHVPRHHRPHPSAYQSPAIRVATSTTLPVIAVLNLLLAPGMQSAPGFRRYNCNRGRRRGGAASLWQC